MGVCGPETNTDLTRIIPLAYFWSLSLAAGSARPLCPSDVHIPAFIGCDPQTLLSDGPPDSRGAGEHSCSEGWQRRC